MLELTSRDGKRTEQVADYVLTEEVLGTGSFGQVVLARHRKSKELVAIKVLTRDNDENTVRRISGEVSTMEKVGAGCPFIVQLYEVLVGHNHIYLVVEFAAGGELFKAMFKPERAQACATSAAPSAKSALANISSSWSSACTGATSTASPTATSSRRTSCSHSTVC